MRPVKSRDPLFIVIRFISNVRPPWVGLGYINQAQLEEDRRLSASSGVIVQVSCDRMCAYPILTYR